MIDKELIQQAKEKLGDKNADLIMDALGVTDWDTKNLKCRCPYHNEDTASFIYDRKRFRFHCFGACGRNYDILDVFMHHSSFLGMRNIPMLTLSRAQSPFSLASVTRQ